MAASLKFTSNQMGDVGKRYCIMRIGQCQDLKGLKTVWESISPAFQKDADVFAIKEQMKRQLEKEKQ